MREMVAAPQAWLLLLFPLVLLLLARSFSLARWFRANGARDRRQQRKELDDDHRLPPSPPALPVLGHLHLVGSLPHVSLRNLARKHGMDLMFLRLGAMPVLVASSPRAAEAVLRTHDHVFASRPQSLVAEVIMYGPSDVGFAPYGDYWRRVRKLVTTQLLSVKKVQSFRHAREEEVGRVMAKIGEAAAAGVAVDVGDLLSSYTNDLACRAVMGNCSSFHTEGRNKLFRELVSDTSPLLGGFNIEEFFPFLARFGVLSKVVRAKSERLRRRWDELLEPLIDDHERQYDAPAAAASDAKGYDFIHVLLSVREEYGLTREQMKALLLDVFFAGIETSAAVLEFTIAELMRRPHLMKKLQAEVRSSVPKEADAVTEPDLAGMTYLRAVIKESHRLHNVTPLLAPRVSMASCNIDGYTIPAGVQVLINTWAIGRDARFWGDDAEEFIPERFIGDASAAHVSFKGNDFQFLPFGSGRRMCAGMNFGMAAVELMLANFVYCFDWELPPGKQGHDIDMAEVFGLVVKRKEKLLLVPKFRVY
ncbi:hypothetical protein SETIT_7G155000v2 [Setaria italica]|uniref:Uncharacterized protein n=1 Tax=Setaria italica TaxID=4555 RepID=K3Y6F7_SETIT|nr:indole-2-monooxygenase [Setaria italica]RCV34374.1 hypothetical protein SETIT_7G155000v2 [Setaria italica]